ncbi:MAG: glycosyltransferase family 2 protein [Bacteroidetes bacterium]|nr:glycosyltransferase family 2 protein [Fibrella sp.]
MSGIVRVIVLNYNRADLTSRCVNSVLAQQVPDCQVVVVDNNSSAVDFYHLTASLPQSVYVVRNAENGGYAAGNNQGIGRLPGMPDADFYLVLNNDVALTHPGTIARLRDALLADTGAIAVSPLVHTLSNAVPVREQIQVRRLLLPGWYVLCQSAVLRRLPGIRRTYNRFIYRDLVPYSNQVYPVDTISGSAFMIRSDYFDRQNGFDTGTFLYEEELILGEQIRRTGHHCLLHGDLIVPHEQGATTGQRPGRVNYRMIRYQLNSLVYFLKVYHQVPAWALGLVRALRWSEFAGKWLLYGLRR